MSYIDLRQRVLMANNLKLIMSKFEESKDMIWHIDRHVIDSIDEIPEGVELTPRDAGFQLGIDLLKEWEACRRASAVFISKPYLIVDDEWLAQEPDAEVIPPHVYICLAKSEESFKPVVHSTAEALPMVFNGNLSLEGLNTKRLYGFDVDDPGAWIIQTNK